MTTSSFAHLVEAYLEGPARLRHAVCDLSRQQLEARPINGKWTTLEVVCHLVDSEQAWCHRMKRVVAEEKPLLIGYDETRFTASLYYHQRNLEPELALLEAMRLQMASIFRGLPETSWTRTGIHNERGMMTLAEMLQAEVEHIPHHIDQIIDKRRALGLSTTGF